MNELNQIRAKINDIDKEMAALFQQRMEMSAQVAALKKERGLSIRDSERERELIRWSAREVEAEPSRLGLSAHLLAVARPVG